MKKIIGYVLAVLLIVGMLCLLIIKLTLDEIVVGILFAVVMMVIINFIMSLIFSN